MPSTSTPATTRPTPPPIPNIAEIVPMPVATFSRGNSSRMIPIASGKIAPPAPWIARPAIITASEPARADTTDPRPNTPSEMSSQCSLPYMSPSRPNSGVATAAVSRNAVSSHVASAGSPPNVRWISGRAGTIIVCASA